jgi:hypothetical protein
MAIKLYLSQANQGHNAGPGGYTEKAGMDALTKAIAAEFARDDRFLVKRNSAGSRIDTARENCLEANAWGADLYVAWHSNAGGVGARGTFGFYYSKASKGYDVAKAIVRRISPLSPGAGEALIAKPEFIEIHTPHCPACLIEVEAHDWRTGVDFIMKQRPEIARAAYVGICEGKGLTPVGAAGPPTSEPVPERIALTDKNITVPRQHKPNRAGWWNFGLVPYIERIREQGDGHRVDTRREDDRIAIPVPKTWPSWWRKMMVWRKSQREDSTQPAELDYVPLKQAAIDVADALGIPHDGVTLTNSKGAAFETLLRAIADYERK